MGQNKALTLAADLCRFFEGFSSKPYICPAGYPTIGYGTVYKPDGTKVTMQDAPISRELANEWLMRELQHNYMAGVLKASPILITNQRLLAAITDFAYN
jgi:lysozyme